MMQVIKNQNYQKQVNLMMIFWISDGHFPMSQRNEKTDIEHGLICLFDILVTVKTLEISDSRFQSTISVIIFENCVTLKTRSPFLA